MTAPSDRRRLAIRDALRAALDEGGALPQSQHEPGQALLHALDSPARIAVMGPPARGKSGVINLLCGGEPIPEDVPLGVIQLSYGETERLTIVMRDGMEIDADDALMLRVMADYEPAMTKIEMPLAALRSAAFMEIPLPRNADARGRALAWAARRVDIALWCTDAFDGDERVAWRAVPDRLKDASIMVRTHADRLDMPQAETLDRLDRLFGHLFSSIVLLSLPDALAAYRDETPDRAALRASGATALFKEVNRFTGERRRGLVDRAEYLLAAHGVEIPDTLPETAQADAAVEETARQEPQVAGEDVQRNDSQNV